MHQSASNHGCELTKGPHWAFLLAFLLLFTTSSSVVLSACIGSVGEVAVNACQQELGSSPRNLKVRLALATALDRLGRQDEAIKVLDQGLVLFSSDESTKSVIEEKIWTIQREKRSSGGSSASAKIKIIKCTTLKGSSALKSCDEGLKILPNNIELLAGKGDVLLDLSPPKVIEAISVYKKALVIVPENQEIKQKLAHAESVRQQSVSDCMKGRGSAALAACDSGLLKGASDEATIHARRGDLLVAMNRDKKALDAYRVAQRLEPGNSVVKRAINSLIVVEQKPPPPREAPKAPKAPKAPEVSEPPVLVRVFSNTPLSIGVTY